MNSITAADTDLDRRLRRLHAGLDASPAFGPALHARIESLRSVEDQAARAERRALAYRERIATEARLRRRFWQTLALTLLVGALAAIGAWLIGDPIGRALLALGTSRQATPSPLAAASVALFIGWLWLFVRGATRGSVRRLAFG